MFILYVLERNYRNSGLQFCYFSTCFEIIRSWWEGKTYTCTVLFPFLLALTFLVWKPAATAWHYYLGGRYTEMSCSPFCLPFHTCIHAVLFCLFMLQNCWNVMSVDFCCSKQTENGNCRLEREQQVWWSLPWFPLDLLKLGILWCQHLLLFFFSSLVSVWFSIMKENTHHLGRIRKKNPHTCSSTYNKDIGRLFVKLCKALVKLCKAFLKNWLCWEG